MLAKINKFNEVNISYETFGEFQRGVHIHTHTHSMKYVLREPTASGETTTTKAKWELLSVGCSVASHSVRL